MKVTTSVRQGLKERHRRTHVFGPRTYCERSRGFHGLCETWVFDLFQMLTCHWVRMSRFSAVPAALTSASSQAYQGRTRRIRGPHKAELAFNRREQNPGGLEVKSFLTLIDKSLLITDLQDLTYASVKSQRIHRESRTCGLARFTMQVSRQLWS